MSETAEPESQGSYDDVPDEFVATVLNVPLRLNPNDDDPTTGQSHPSTGGRARHRKPDPVPPPLADAPATTHFTPRGSTPTVLPAHNAGAEPLRRRVTPHTHHEFVDSHWLATTKVGGISAAIVFCAAAVLLVFLTWLP